MDNSRFEAQAKQLIEYSQSYFDRLEHRLPSSDVKPGFLRGLVPNEAPQDAEEWEKVFADIDRVIMKGSQHCKSPNNYTFTPTGASHPSLLATILSDTLCNFTTNWSDDPFMTELEPIVLDWLVKMMGLPLHFLSTGEGTGLMMNSGSEGNFTSVLYARELALSGCSDKFEAASKLVAYCSDQSHQSCTKACLIAMVQCTMISTNEKFQMTAKSLKKAIEDDEMKGMKPFHVTVTLGTTGSCAFDELPEIGKLCAEKDVWLHVDAVACGASFICPEYRYLMDGIQHAHSFTLNPYKWLLVHAPCSVLWLRNKKYMQIFSIDGSTSSTMDYAQWPWALVSGRRVKSLNLWFVMRMYGQAGLQQHLREDISLAKEMEQLLLQDGRFEILNDVIMYLVCFRIKGTSEKTNRALCQTLNEDKRIWIMDWETKGIYFIRFCINSDLTKSKHIKFAYKVIAEMTQKVLHRNGRRDVGDC